MAVAEKGEKMPIKGEQQGYTYKALINGEWQEVTIQESPLELVERFEQDVEWTRVRHGRWISTGFMEVKCSICGAIQHELEDTNYCPNCGAKMDEVKEDELEDLPSADTPQEWIPCSERLPNDDEILYDGIAREGGRYVSDRILAIDKDGFIRIGYFMNAMDAPRFGKRYEFGEHYRNDPTKWICGESCEIYDPIAWMPLPNPYAEEE